MMHLFHLQWLAMIWGLSTGDAFTGYLTLLGAASYIMAMICFIHS